MYVFRGFERITYSPVAPSRRMMPTPHLFALPSIPRAITSPLALAAPANATPTPLAPFPAPAPLVLDMATVSKFLSAAAERPPSRGGLRQWPPGDTIIFRNR